MNKVERELKQVGLNDYELTMTDSENRLKTVKLFTKEELKEAYKTNRMQIGQLEMRVKQLKKEITDNDVMLTKEEKKTLALMEKAVKYDKKKKALEQLDMINKDIELFRGQLKEISGVIPEVLREK